jgi:hypothetical protein
LTFDNNQKGGLKEEGSRIEETGVRRKEPGRKRTHEFKQAERFFAKREKWELKTIGKSRGDSKDSGGN